MHSENKQTKEDGKKEIFWDTFCSELKSFIPDSEFSKWISPIKFSHLQNDQVHLSVPNTLFIEELNSHFKDSFKKAKNVLGIDHVDFKFNLDNSPLNNETMIELLHEWNQNPQEKDIDFSSQVLKEKEFDGVEIEKTIEKEFLQKKKAFELNQVPITKTNLNRNYTFETFVKGPSNQFAMATCLAVADEPGKTYNPLFIYGSTGLGKTHLLHAVGNKIFEKNPSAVIIYISSERFMNELIYCLRFNKMWEFRQKYRFCDVFLIDDIQFISGKERTQEEFFHTFNTLYEAKKQLVITSDLFPRDIPDIGERLRNRFQWGLIADIQPPDVEHRMAILYSKADQLGIKLSEDVCLYIANQIKKNVRELEGALHRMTAYSCLHARPIDMSLARDTFKDILGEPSRKISIDNIQKVVADYFKIKISDLKSKKRQRALTVPRQVAMYFSRQFTTYSFPEIAERFGGKDHTTVMYAVRKIDDEKKENTDLKLRLDSIQRQIEQLQ